MTLMERPSVGTAEVARRDHVLPCEREPVCEVQVEGHPDILCHAFEQPADAVDRFFRASRLGSRLPEADVLMQRQIYRFLAGVMKEDEARLRAVHLLWQRSARGARTKAP